MKIYNLAALLLFPLHFCNQASHLSQPSLTGVGPAEQKKLTKTANIVSRSTDGGATWQDISNGLPLNFKVDSIRGNSFFANEKGLYVRLGNQFYHNASNFGAPFWTQEISPVGSGSMPPRMNKILYWGVHLKTASGTSIWSPIFENYQEPRIRSVFETAGGALFIATDQGLFKTVDSGKTWKQVYAGGLLGHMAESGGVLLATSMRRIIKSTDGGESWAVVAREGSVSFDVKPIKGGFAAITASSETNTRSLKTSYDGGKTWQPINTGHENKTLADSIWRTWDDRPRVQAVMTSIIKVGENFICTHPDGVFRSSDNGKTWRLLLPSVEGKLFGLFRSGNVVYAVPGNRGC